MVEPQGDGCFKYVLVTGSKAAPRVVDVKWGGRAPPEEAALQLAAIMAEARKLTAR